jgi:DNA-directed RNA polymerase specialized sigma24 family protein
VTQLEHDDASTPPLGLALGRSKGPRTAPAVPLTDADLNAAGVREPAAVARVYAAWAPALYRWLTVTVGDRHDAEQLTGTIFAAAIGALPGRIGPAGRFGGELFGLALAELRRLPADRPAAPGGRGALAALRRLPADEREVLLLRLVAGLPAEDVAVATGRRHAAVLTLVQRGLARLAAIGPQRGGRA